MAARERPHPEVIVNDPRKAPSKTSPAPAKPFAHALAALVAALIAVALYAPTLGFQYTMDDHALIEINGALAPGAPLGPIVLSDFWAASGEGSGMWRPLVMLSYAFDVRQGAGALRSGHLGNVALHGLASGVVVLCAGELGAGAIAAGIAGAWFAVMPAHADSVAPVWGRPDLMCTLFFLLAYLLHRRARRTGTAWPVALALASLALALLAKEAAAVFVIVIAIDEWARSRESRPDARALLLRVLPAGALTLAWAIAHQAVVGRFAAPTHLTSTLRSEAGLAAWTLFPSELAFLFPFYPHSPLVPVHQPTSAADAAVLGGAALLLAAIAGFVVLARRRSAWAMPLALFTLGVLPGAWAMARYGYITLGERYIHLGSAGAAFALALAMQAFAGNARTRRAAWAFAALLIASSAFTGAQALAAYRDDLTVYSAMVRLHPNDASGHIGLAQVLGPQGRTEDALQQLLIAERLNPGLPEVFQNRAMIFMSAGRWAEGLAQADRALALDAANTPARLMRDMALIRLRRVPEAMAELEPFVRANPGNTDAHSLLGEALFLADRPADAVPHLQAAAAGMAQNPQVRFALGQCLMRLGRPREARAEFEACVAIDPNDPGSWHRLADACEQLGDASATQRARARFAALTAPQAPPAP